MSSLQINFPEKLYVGTEQRKAFDPANPPLGFATPFGSDSAFTKRQKTVDDWCGDGFVFEYELDADGREKIDARNRYVGQRVQIGFQNPQVLDNTFQEGFSLDKVVSRWTTSNKWFRVTDPRGFQLEISSENLSDILLNGEVKKGNISGRFIWGRANGHMYLTREDHPSYVEHIQPTYDRALRVGDLVLLGNKTENFLYCGVGWVYFFDVRTETREIGGHRGYFSRDGETDYVMETKRDKTPYHIFEALDGYYSGKVMLMRKPSKVRILAENHPAATFQYEQIVRTMDYHHAMLFVDKSKVMAFNPSDTETAKIIGQFYTAPKWGDRRHTEV